MGYTIIRSFTRHKRMSSYSSSSLSRRFAMNVTDGGRGKTANESLCTVHVPWAACGKRLTKRSDISSSFLCYYPPYYNSMPFCGRHRGDFLKLSKKRGTSTLLLPIKQGSCGVSGQSDQLLRTTVLTVVQKK